MIRLIVVALMFASAANAKAPIEITLTNGFVMRECEIVRWSTDGVVVKYVGGTVPIKFANIDGRQRKVLEARKAKGLQAQAIADNAAVSQTEVEKKQQQEEAEQITAEQRKADEIKKAISDHRLVVGMTLAQAREAFGTPSSSSLSESGGGFIFYEGRGHDVHGAQCDREVFLTGGVVTGWVDQKFGF